MNNKEIARLLRNISAAYQVKGENRFKIVAYEKAADNIENYPSEVRDLWEEKKLSTIAGVGSAIQQHLDELFRAGKVKHFTQVTRDLPQGMFVLLQIPGFGPKRAYKLAKKFNIVDAKSAIEKIEKIAKTGKIAQLPGFGEKSQKEILKNIESYRRKRTKAYRSLLHQADQVATEVVDYLSSQKEAIRVDVLGSLRRRNETIGDIDVAVSTHNPQRIIKHFLAFPKTQKVIEKGPAGASIILKSGKQVDLRVQEPDKYGAMLQYFTGSKNHNIKLRELALSKGKSLSEYGIKERMRGKWGEPIAFSTEENFYKALELPWIEPELRENRGEVEVALRSAQGKSGGLPKLVEEKDLRGDLHIHSDYDLEPSHDLGQDPIESILKVAKEKKHEYIGISDHNPSISKHNKDEIVAILKRRKQCFEKQNYSSTKSRVQIFIMLEIDILPNGLLAVPNEGFEHLDAAVVSIHSSFGQSRADMTKRIIAGLSHPKAKILGHPTARFLGSRESINANWDTIFDFCKKHNKALEINASPSRLDLPDVLVIRAVQKRVKLVINTDSHDSASMNMMRYGVDVARRGWATKRDILNTLAHTQFAKWLRE